MSQRTERCAPERVKEFLTPAEECEIASIVNMRTKLNNLNRELLEKGAKLTMFENGKIQKERYQAYRYYA